jgi:glycosyltransferase involved in cell wall biosynthesis
VRVLLDYRPALRARSGVGEYAHELAKALLRAHPDPSDLSLTLFSSSWKDRLRLEPELERAAAVDRRVPVRLLNLLWHRFERPCVETLLGARFDVTHSLHPLMLPARAAARVVTVHDLNFVTHPERTAREIRRDYPRLAASHARRADRVIVPSRFTAGQVERRLGVPIDAISVCPPGAPAWSPRNGPLEGTGYVLFVGTLEPRKNIGGLLDAYEKLLCRGEGGVPDLVLAGGSTPEAREWLDRIARPPLRGLVRYAGYIDPAKRKTLYEGARLLVQPSFEEGFGLPVLEAMTVGVPVVAANRGALPEVLGDAGLLVDPEDSDALASALQQMLGDEALAGAAAAKGVLRARSFSWTDTARAVYEAYRLAMARHRERAAK